MGRLTERDEHELGIWVDEQNELYDFHKLVEPSEIIYPAIKKLAHYEDLEEQGRLIEQKHGYWIKSRKYYDDGYTVIGSCSNCGLEFQAKLLRKICYCPHCGAKMLTKEEAEAKLRELNTHERE